MRTQNKMTLAAHANNAAGVVMVLCALLPLALVEFAELIAARLHEARVKRIYRGYQKVRGPAHERDLR